jgi:hypothetical protein
MPFFGPPECAGTSCKFYSHKQFLIVQEELAKGKTPEPTHHIAKDDEEEDTQLNFKFAYGWSPQSGWSLTKNPSGGVQVAPIKTVGTPAPMPTADELLKQLTYKSTKD